MTLCAFEFSAEAAKGGWSAKMGPDYISQDSQAVRRHRLAEACLIAIALVLVLASCTSSTSTTTPTVFSPSVTPTSTEGSTQTGGSPQPVDRTQPVQPPTAPTPPVTFTPGSTATPGTNPYRQFDQEVAGLVKRTATWQVPKQLEVKNTTRVGLVIGDRAMLHGQINALVPGTHPKPAGQVKVGSTIGVQLVADPDDASVVPSEAIDQSIGEHTSLLWTWFVWPTHPNPDLLLTAEIVVKMTDGHILRTEKPISIPVGRTWQYTVGQIFTNWLTWVSIVTVLSAGLGWIWRRRKRPGKPRPPSRTPNRPRKPSPASRRSPTSRSARRRPRLPEHR